MNSLATMSLKFKYKSHETQLFEIRDSIVYTLNHKILEFHS